MNYYEILGVKQDASKEEIKKAYRNLVKAFHPDYYHGDKDFAEEKTRELNRIYETLGDDEGRKKYDDTHGIHQVTGVSYAFGDFYHTAEGKRKAGVEIPDYYDPDIFYPGYRETGDWYVDAVTIYSLPDPEGYRSDIDFTAAPMPESFGLSAAKLPKIKKDYEALCDEELAYIEELHKKNKKYKRISEIGFAEAIGTFLFGPGLLALPVMGVLYMLQRDGRITVPVLVYPVLAVYAVLATGFFISQRRTDRKVNEYFDEIESYSYEELPEEMRRYVQYEYMMMEFENYQTEE